MSDPAKDIGTFGLSLVLLTKLIACTQGFLDDIRRSNMPLPQHPQCREHVTELHKILTAAAKFVASEPRLGD